MARKMYGLAKSQKVYGLFCVIARNKKMSVSGLAKTLKTVPSVVSEQLIPLKEKGLVFEEKKGRFRFFSVNRKQFKKIFKFDLNLLELKKRNSFVELLVKKKGIRAAVEFGGVEFLSKKLLK